MACKLKPEVKLRVFISSAQREENGFNWKDVRSRVKKRLEGCPFLSPFIIDTVASEIPSTQLFQYEVLKSDIIVMLIKGVVREGTSIEFAEATKHKKPLLVYFIEDDNPSLDVAKLKKAVSDSDTCTYCYLHPQDKIEEIVYNGVIDNVVRSYQFDRFQRTKAETKSLDISSNHDEQTLKISVPTKTAISQFSSCYPHIYDLCGINNWEEEKKKEESSLHKFGIACLEWLVRGTPFDCDGEILNLVNQISSLYSNTEWYIKRWDAIRYALKGDFKGALDFEKQALALAKRDSLPTWIINNILIDCRNIEQEVHNQNREWMGKSEAQAEIDESNTIVFLPVVDRYLTNVYTILEREEEKYKTASPTTVFYGSNFERAVTEVENYFFSAVMYGSYTHVLESRSILIRVFLKYGEILEENAFLLNALRLLILSGRAENFKKTLNSIWNDVHAGITANADELWLLTNQAFVASRNKIKLAVIRKLGLYFNESNFMDAERFLEEFSSNVYWGNSEEFFETLNQNMSRLNHEKVIRALTGILDEQRFHLGGKISKVILRIKLNNVDEDVQNSFCNALQKRLSFIIKNGGIPQIIAALAMQNERVFSILATIPENGLVGVEKDYYEINMGRGSWLNVLKYAVKLANEQFEENKNPGVYKGSFELPYATIKEILREHFDPSMNETIEKEFYPLCAKVLRSQTVMNIKNDCIDCLCDVLALTSKCGTRVPEELKEAVDNIDISNCRSVFGDYRASLDSRILMARIILGLSDKEEMLESSFSYSKKDYYGKIALVECAEQFIIHNLNSKHIDATIVSIVLQCFDDERFEVRERACSCFVWLLETKYTDLAERKLCEAAIDPSEYVRSYILNLCKKGRIGDLNVNNKLIDVLRNDANYAIRTGCD